MELLGLPMVTLVVKAPNQKVADHTVECDLGWTVEKLKEHLADVYPSKPQRHDQRLIYSGQLLLDHMPLKDVLRQYTEGQTIHTVHLVCSQSHEQAASLLHNTQSNSPAATERSTLTSMASSSDSGLADSSEGLRYRSTAAPLVPQTTEEAPQMFGGNPSHYGQMGMPPAAAMTMPGMVPGMMAYSPEQMMWMQQMYAQQMAHYMQFFQQAGQTGEDDQDDAREHGANTNDVPQAVNQRPAAAGNQQIRMNAQGGAVLDDDDEDNINRDWLDWLYTFSRFGVLMTIVYFYSTFSRFVLVSTFFFMVYLYQMGWFRINRRQVQEQREEEVQQDDPQTETERDSSEDSDREGVDSIETEPDQPVRPADPPRPGVISVAWSFFFTFFTSLLPEQPQAVNAN